MIRRMKSRHLKSLVLLACTFLFAGIVATSASATQATPVDTLRTEVHDLQTGNLTSYYALLGPKLHRTCTFKAFSPSGRQEEQELRGVSLARLGRSSRQGRTPTSAMSSCEAVSSSGRRRAISMSRSAASGSTSWRQVPPPAEQPQHSPETPGQARLRSVIGGILGFSAGRVAQYRLLGSRISAASATPSPRFSLGY